MTDIIYLDESRCHADSRRDCGACGEQHRQPYTRDELVHVLATTVAQTVDVVQSAGAADWSAAEWDDRVAGLVDDCPLGVTADPQMPDGIVLVECRPDGVWVHGYIYLWISDDVDDSIEVDSVRVPKRAAS